MKLKLFNGQLLSLSLAVVAGGYDQEDGRVTIIVRQDEKTAGTLKVDVSEANVLIGILGANLPKVERVESVPSAGDPLGQGHVRGLPDAIGKEGGR